MQAGLTEHHLMCTDHPHLAYTIRCFMNWKSAPKYKIKGVKNPPWHHCRHLTVLWPALLTAPSSRWLFPWPDEMRKPWQASQKSQAINLALWRVLCMPRLLVQGYGSDYSLQALNGNCSVLCWASQRTEELCCLMGLGLFQVIQDRLVKVGKAYSGWLGSETRPPAS